MAKAGLEAWPFSSQENTLTAESAEQATKFSKSQIPLRYLVRSWSGSNQLRTSERNGILYFKNVCLCAHLTLYPATDCTAATDISGVSSRWQLSR